MARKGSPRWDPTWSKATERFDFESNRWTTDPPIGATLKSEPAPWNMPPCGNWVDTERHVVSFEEQLLKSPWIFAVYLTMILVTALARFGLHLPSLDLAILLVAVGQPLLIMVTSYVLNPRVSRFISAQNTREDDLDQDVCPVLLTITQDGVVTGEDEGVAWFENFALYFNGSRCSFAVGQRDIRPEPTWKLAAKSTEGFVYSDDSVFLRHPDRLVGLKLTPAFFVGDLGELPEPAKRFLSRKSEFRARDRGPEHACYPPLTVSPELRQDPLPFKHLERVQLATFIYIGMIGMIAGVPIWYGLLAATVYALSVSLLRPRRDPRLVAMIQKEKLRR